MEEKIAVHCTTKGEWNKVQAKLNVTSPNWTPSNSCWDTYRERTCINILHLGFCSVRWYKARGYTIISAAEYLNEGGKDVKKLLKKGDEVEITQECDGHDSVGKLLPLGSDQLDSNGCTVVREDGTNWYYPSTKYIIITTKENKMSLQINSIIRKVFKGAEFEQVEKMQEHFGSEIQENFSGEIFLKANKKKFEDEIIRRDEEAKRLEKEEKEG